MSCACRFRGPVCPEWLQEQLLVQLIESAERGRPGFKEMLTMTPCDIFSLLRGRTLWLMGDSMMQVGPAYPQIRNPYQIFERLMWSSQSII